MVWNPAVITAMALPNLWVGLWDPAMQLFSSFSLFSTPALDHAINLKTAIKEDSSTMPLSHKWLHGVATVMKKNIRNLNARKLWHALSATLCLLEIGLPCHTSEAISSSRLQCCFLLSRTVLCAYYCSTGSNRRNAAYIGQETVSNLWTTTIIHTCYITYHCFWCPVSSRT